MRYTGRLGQRHFHVQKQRDMIAGHGATCLVIPVVMCPCLLREQLFDPLCASCGGSGRFPQTQLQFETTLAFLADQSTEQDHPEGMWTEGQVRCLAPPEVSLTAWDTVTVLDIRETFSEVLQRGVRETVRFQQGVTVSLVRDRTTVYVPTTDYTLAPPSTVTWTGGGASPAAQAYYSVRYAAHPTYAVVGDNPRLRLEHHTAQATLVTLRRLDQLDRERPFSTP